MMPVQLLDHLAHEMQADCKATLFDWLKPFVHKIWPILLLLVKLCVVKPQLQPILKNLVTV